jgi:hypothetical protein
VPCVLGAAGLERVIELKLDDHETRATPSWSCSTC